MSKARFLHSWTLDPEKLPTLDRAGDGTTSDLCDTVMSTIEARLNNRSHRFQVVLSSGYSGIGDIVIKSVSGIFDKGPSNGSMVMCSSHEKLKRKNGISWAPGGSFAELDIDATIATYHMEDPCRQLSRVSVCFNFNRPARIPLEQLIESVDFLNASIIFRIFIDIPMKYLSKHSKIDITNGMYSDCSERYRSDGADQSVGANPALGHWKLVYGSLKHPANETSSEEEDNNPGLYSDFQIIIDDMTYYCHKVILCQSPVMNQMFQTGGTVESNESRSIVTDIEPAIFEQFLSYLYTGTADLWNHAESLLYVAEKYQVHGLLDDCERALVPRVDADNSVELLLTADLFKLDALKDACIIAIGQNRDRVVRTSQWKDLLARPDLVTEMFQIDTIIQAPFLEFVSEPVSSWSLTREDS